MFDNTKGLIRSRKLNAKQSNCQKKKHNRTNNDPQNTHVLRKD